MIRANICFLLFLLVFFIGCSTPKKDFDWAKYKKDNPELYAEAHNQLLLKPLEEREAFYSEELFRDSKENMIKHRPWIKIDPIQGTLTSFERKILKNEISLIPKEVKKMLEKRILGWIIVENLGVSGTIFLNRNEGHYYEKSFILIDKSSIGKSFQQACEDKENSGYPLENGYRISCSLSKNLSWLHYIFLHEAAHILARQNTFVANSELNEFNQSLYPFSRLSWLQIDDGIRNTSHFEQKLKIRNSAKYYAIDARDKISGENFIEFLKAWEKSNFPSLYSMSNAAEDWADSFTLYIFKKYYNVDYLVRLEHKGKKVFEAKGCFSSKFCEQKTRLLKFYFENSDLFL